MTKSFLIVFVLIIPALIFLLKPNYFTIHDSLQPLRQLEYEKCFNDGQIPCRWLNDLGDGYGNPLFNYYPPLPYIIGQLFRVFHLSLLDTIKAVAILQILFAAFAMYLLSSYLFGTTAGVLASIFYTYSPYHALNIFVRGAMNETWAAVFFPLIFYFTLKIIKYNRVSDCIFLSLSFAALLLSHLPMVIIFTPFILIWYLFWMLIYKKSFLSKMILLLLSAIFASALTAFFTLPVLFESNLINLKPIFSDYYTFSAHFTTLKQLFISSFWFNGPSVWGVNDGLSFSLGYLLWLTPLCLFSLSIYLLNFKKKLLFKINQINIYLFMFIITLGVISLFLTHERSIIIWKLFPLIQIVQFPWRFLNLAIFFFSLSISFIPLFINNLKISKYTNFICYSLCVIYIIINLPYFHSYKSTITNDNNFFSSNWHKLVSGKDYTPKSAQVPIQYTPDNLIGLQSPPASAVIYNEKQGTDWLSFTANVKNKSTLTINKLYFPNFVVEVNQKTFPFTIEPEIGRMVIKLDNGPQQVYIKLHNTPVRSFSNYLSVFSWILLIGYLASNLWKSFKTSKR